MAGHPYVSQIDDQPTRQALLSALSRITQLEAQVTALQAATLDAKSARILNVADPTAGSDAVNLQTLQTYVGARANK